MTSNSAENGYLSSKNPNIEAEILENQTPEMDEQVKIKASENCLKKKKKINFVKRIILHLLIYHLSSRI